MSSPTLNPAGESNRNTTTTIHPVSPQRRSPDRSRSPIHNADRSPEGGTSSGDSSDQTPRHHSSSQHHQHGSRRRSHSLSPMSNRRRHIGSRDAPTPSKVLAIFGMSEMTSERDIDKLFSKYGSLRNVRVVVDNMTRKSRGYAFVEFMRVCDAKIARETLTSSSTGSSSCSSSAGPTLHGRTLRIDYSITRRAHSPTPGIYVGKPSFRSTQNEEGGGNNNMPPSRINARSSTSTANRSRGPYSRVQVPHQPHNSRTSHHNHRHYNSQYGESSNTSYSSRANRRYVAVQSSASVSNYYSPYHSNTNNRGHNSNSNHHHHHGNSSAGMSRRNSGGNRH